MTSFLRSRLLQNQHFVTLNLFQGLPELASGLKQVQHDIFTDYDNSATACFTGMTAGALL